MKRIAASLLASSMLISPLSLALGDNIKVHGFASFGASQLSKDIDGLTYEGGQKSDLSIYGNTWLGFQIDAELTPSTNFVYQVIVEADESKTDNFDTRTEWMYLKQDLGAGFNTQIGRIRLPAFMDSEVLYVGQTYPWVNAPSEIYNQLPVNHIDGISLNQRSELGDWTLDTKAILWGQSKDDSEGYSISLDKTYGIAFDANYDELRLHLAYLVATEIINIDTPAGLYPALPNGMQAEIEDKLTHIVLGARYDNGQLYASTELLKITADKGTQDETEAFNITFGWHFGDVLPYISLSKTETPNADNLADSINDEFPMTFIMVDTPDYTGPSPIGNVSAPFFMKQQQSLSIGVKYDITPTIALKAQAQYIDDFNDTGGLFSGQTSLPFEDIYLYDLAVQAIF